MAVMAKPRCPAAKYFPSGENPMLIRFRRASLISSELRILTRTLERGERIGRIEVLALEDLGLRLHVKEVEREIIVHAGEGLAVRREQALQTGFADDHFVRLAQFLFGDAPDFDPQIGSVEHDVQRIWRELSFLGFWRVDAEDWFERLASQHVDARVVLGQDVFAVRAEAQMSDVAPKRRLERRLRGDRVQGFFAAQPV